MSSPVRHDGRGSSVASCPLGDPVTGRAVGGAPEASRERVDRAVRASRSAPRRDLGTRDLPAGWQRDLRTDSAPGPAPDRDAVPLPGPRHRGTRPAHDDGDTSC
ncbi:hypothetical protein [Streptomyces sp. NPDC020965]|uniref:hypothetical protein n=1 Tax=Streptomyces sp. NPDC020965 TaxID=3365105 RepID=UPI00379CDBC0